jgi:hypothetical protein
MTADTVESSFILDPLLQNTVHPELVEGFPFFSGVQKKGGLRQAQPERLGLVTIVQ